MPATQPIRSSLLFSPVPVDHPTGTLTDSNNTPPQSIGSTHGQSNSVSIPPTSDPSLVDSSIPVGRHHRRRSDFRSKSTDQIITGNMLQSNSSVITAATTTTSVSGSKFTNLNVSQPVLRTAPLAPVPIIPATRFDTITSYVDVIYQHHQQQQQQQQSNSLQLNSPSDNYAQSSHDPENSLEGLENNQSGNDDANVVYLDPSDGIDGDQSFMATCPQCAMMVMTEIQPFPGKQSRKMSCLLSPLLLCWLPFNLTLGKKWMDVRHACPKCRSLIAIYRK